MDGSQDDAHGDLIQQHVEQCLECLQPSAAEQREALGRALQLTAEALGVLESNDDAQGDAGDSQQAGQDAAARERRRWLRAARVRVLQHLERLDTILELNNGAWYPAAFASLRDCTVAEAAAALAAAGRVATMPLLLRRHPRALLPSALDVLSAIPETLDPKQYAQLIKQVAAEQAPPPLGRAPDWVESAATAAELRAAGQYALLLATEPMCALAGWRPPTRRQLARWACERAQQLDAATGQLPFALSLLDAAHVALHHGEASVSRLLGTAQELLSLLKLAAARNGGGSSTWRTTLRQYAALQPVGRLALLLGLLESGDSLAEDLALHVAPFLARLAAPAAGGDVPGGGGSHADHEGGEEGEAAVDPQLVLRQALEAEAAERLPWVVSLVQAEARRRTAFASAAQLAKTAAACCYACTASDAWELMGAMLRAAGDAVHADDELAPEARHAAAEALDVVRGHVTTARLLTKHGLTTPVRAVRNADRAAALRLLRTLLARVSRTKNSESRWVEVWMDLRAVRERGLAQLGEDDVRAEFCRALLRVGQYRLCGSYLQGLPLEAAEQLVLAAGREVFLSASSMRDRAVKQAKECLSLLPASAAAQEQLAGIAAAEQLQALGLDLPPLQLQQLREQAAGGGGKELEQLVAEHPQLVAADGGKLKQLAAALGLAPQQEAPLLLRAAEAAVSAGDPEKAESLLIQLAVQHFRPAWRLAASVSAHPSIGTASKRQLLTFALAAAPAEELFALLEHWVAADTSSSSTRDGSRGGWELDPSGESAAAPDSASAAERQRRQQLWLAQQLKRHFGAGMAGTVGGTGGGAAALGCLLALGPKGLVLWERLIREQPQRPLSAQQRRHALLLGLTAAALLAMQPASLDAANAAAAVAAAKARLAAPPAELLRLVLVQQQQQQQQAGSGSGSFQGSFQGDDQASEAASEGGDAGGSAPATPPPTGASPLTPGGAAAAAAAAAAVRFHGQLLSIASAEQLQHLLPEVDAAAALAGDAATQRAFVLQLAAAAGTPPALRGAASGGGPPPSPSLPSPAQRLASSPSPSGSGVRRMASRKKSEGLGAEGAAASAGHAGAGVLEAAAAASGTPGRAAYRQVDAATSAEMMRQALHLAAKCGVAAWEVHLAFAEALLLHSQQLWQQERAAWAAVQELLEQSLAALLEETQAAARFLTSLLGPVWRAASSSSPRHLSLCLHFAQRTAAALATAAAGNAAAQAWQQAAAVLSSCLTAADQLHRSAAGMDSKLFLQPVVQELASALLDSTGQGTNVSHPAAPASDLHQQLLAHVTGSNAEGVASTLELLAQQLQLSGGSAYPCNRSTVFLALFCGTISQREESTGGPSKAAWEESVASLQHMAAADAASAAAFAAAGGPFPLELPSGAEQPLPVGLTDGQRAQLLGAALQMLDGSGSGSGAADEELLERAGQLRQQHALLAAYGALAAAWPQAPSSQVASAREAAQAVQQAALAGGQADPHLDGCLQHLLTAGCAAAAALRVAAVLQALLREPQQAPQAADALLARPVTATAAQGALAAAAETAVSSALRAMSGKPAGGTDGERQLSPGDAVQNLFALLRSLHLQQPGGSDEPLARSPAAAGPDAAEAAAAAAAGDECVAALRLLVWEQLQQEAAAYDGSGGAAASEAHVQVLELLGSVGSSSMWPGWAPPELPAAGDGGSDEGGGFATTAGFAHRQVLLFTRTAAALAAEWPAAVQEGRLSAADFASSESAEAAMLRLAAAAEEAAQLRLLLRLLADVLSGVFAPDAGDAAGEAAERVASGVEGNPSTAAAHEPLHRVWSTCLRLLLPLGDLAGVLAALDEQQARRLQAPAPPLLTEAEAAALSEAADATHGAAAAAAVAVLLSYPRLLRERWQQLLGAAGAGTTAADLAAALPGLAALLLLVVQLQPALLLELVSSGDASQHKLWKLVIDAALQQQQRDPGFAAPLSGGPLSLRMATAAVATAQLAAARQYTAAGWLAMLACGTPRLLRVLDNSGRVLQQLLRSCSPGSPAATTAAGAASGLAAVPADAGHIAVPQAAAALLLRLPELSAQALVQLEADLGLS